MRVSYRIDARLCPVCVKLNPSVSFQRVVPPLHNCYMGYNTSCLCGEGELLNGQIKWIWQSYVRGTFAEDQCFISGCFSLIPTVVVNQESVVRNRFCHAST